MPVNDQEITSCEPPEAANAKILAADANRYGAARRELLGTMELGWNTPWAYDDQDGFSGRREYSIFHPWIANRYSPSQNVLKFAANGSGREYTKAWMVLQWISLYRVADLAKEDWDFEQTAEKSPEGFLMALPGIYQYQGENGSHSYSLVAGSPSSSTTYWHYLPTTFVAANRTPNSHYLYQQSMEFQQEPWDNTRPWAAREGFTNCFLDTGDIPLPPGYDNGIWNQAVLEMEFKAAFDPTLPLVMDLRLQHQHMDWIATGDYANYPRFKDEDVDLPTDSNGNPHASRLFSKVTGCSLWAQ